MQGLIVAITLLAAVAYIGWRIYTALARAHDPCHGCQGCALRDMTRKAHAKEKGKQAHCDREHDTKDYCQRRIHNKRSEVKFTDKRRTTTEVQPH